MTHKILVTDCAWPALDVEWQILNGIDAELIEAPDELQEKAAWEARRVLSGEKPIHLVNSDFCSEHRV